MALRYHKHKKGVIEVQLNWIFILIVGAIILLFFVFVSKSITKSAEVKTSQKILTNIDALLTGTSTTEKTASRLEIPKTDITYTCFVDEGACSPQYGCTSGFEYTKTGKAIDTSSLVIFSPEKISGPSLITWTQDWQFPFKVMNVMFLSRPDIKYILVAEDEDALANEIQELFADNEFLEVMRIKKSDLLAAVIDQNDYWIRIVYFDGIVPSSKLELIKAKHLDAIVIDQENSKVTFQDLKQATKWYNIPLPYVDAISLVGAIVSESPEHYVCNMNKALIRYQKVYDLIKKRSEKISQEINGNPDKSSCAFFYQLSWKELGGAGSLPLLTDDNYMDDITQFAVEIEEQNRNALINSCPRIY